MNRISCLSNFIGKSQCVYDVGSDHALLAISLLKANKTKRVVNIEISQSPLNQGIANLEKHRLIDKVENIVNDGLMDITRLTDSIPDYICIAGMGGDTIIHILANKDPSLPKDTKFVLEANTEFNTLRKWLSANNFETIQEETVLDRNKFYQILLVKQGTKGDRLTEFDAYFGKRKYQIDLLAWNQHISYVKEMIERKNLDKFNNDFAELYRYIKECKKWK